MITRLTSFALALAFALAAVLQLMSTLRARPLIAFAASVERSESEDSANEDLLARVRIEIENRRGCEQLLARSRVTASLFLLRQSVGSDRDEQYRTLAVAAEQARRALACNPMDGNLWFAKGWLDHQLAPNAELLKEHIHLAIRFAPYEGRELESRWLTLSPTFFELGFARDAVLLADLDRLYELSRPAAVAAAHDSLMNNGAADIAATAFAKLTEKRRKAVEKALESRRSSSGSIGGQPFARG